MYKVGDRVIAIKDTSYSRVGGVGVIDDVNLDPQVTTKVLVTWEASGLRLWLHDGSYKLLQSPPLPSKRNWFYRFFFTGIE